jgi:hypothetical protein
MRSKSHMQNMQIPHAEYAKYGIQIPYHFADEDDGLHTTPTSASRAVTRELVQPPGPCVRQYANLKCKSNPE